MGRRFDVRRRIESLDPAKDFVEIYRLMATVEFPWDMNQALSFALFRTYAVPSIGGLLARTGEFVERTQKRYDDTVLILDAVLEHGFDSDPGRTAIRRMNQMHRSYDISNDDLRYVLATFVVTPIRWLDGFGWRRLGETERVASANYYRALGRRMGIRDIPGTWQAFARLLDDYEREHFGFDPGGRRVAESTLALLATFPPHDRLPAGLSRRLSLATMDGPLLAAFRFPVPSPALRALVRAASSGSCRRAGSRSTAGCCRSSAAIPMGTRSTVSARSRPAARCRPRARRNRTGCPRRSSRSPERAGCRAVFWAMVRVPVTRPGRLQGVVSVDVDAFQPAAGSPPGLSGGMVLALAMNRRARGLRGLDVLRRSQDRAPPQH